MRFLWIISSACESTAAAAAAAKSLQSCPTLCWPHRRQPTRLPRPWDSPGKNTGVGCHFLLQCIKVKSESEVAQSCPTLQDPMDCSLPGSSVHGIFQARVLEWGAIAFSVWIYSYLNCNEKVHIPLPGFTFYLQDYTSIYVYPCYTKDNMLVNMLLYYINIIYNTYC